MNQIKMTPSLLNTIKLVTSQWIDACIKSKKRISESAYIIHLTEIQVDDAIKNGNIPFLFIYILRKMLINRKKSFFIA